MPPHARPHWHDAYDAQMELWRWYRTQDGITFLGHSFQQAAENMRDETREMMLDLHQGERNRLLDLDPIYVSEEMCEVVAAAKDSFEPEPLLETDLMTQRGFLYYEQAFIVPARFDEPTSIKAVSWQRIFNTEGVLDKTEYEALLTKLTQGNVYGVAPGKIEEAEEFIQSQGAYPWGITLTLYADRDDANFAHPERFPRLIPLHLTPWYFGMTFDGNEVDENGVETGAAWWWKIVQTTFRLMQQRIAHKGLMRPDRATRREAAKLHMPDEREIVVIRLRREAGEHAEPSGEKANYSHRFIRSGHWRNQWYPSAQIHRQIWISPMVVGDPSLPLIVRPRRVYQWER
jgi:hypothetical protein